MDFSFSSCTNILQFPIKINKNEKETFLRSFSHRLISNVSFLMRWKSKKILKILRIHETPSHFNFLSFLSRFYFRILIFSILFHNMIIIFIVIPFKRENLKQQKIWKVFSIPLSSPSFHLPQILSSYLQILSRFHEGEGGLRLSACKLFLIFVPSNPQPPPPLLPTQTHPARTHAGIRPTFFSFKMQTRRKGKWKIKILLQSQWK